MPTVALPQIDQLNQQLNQRLNQRLKWIRPFGVDIFCLGKKFLVFNLVSRNLKTKYHRSVFGIFWTLLAPLAMALIYYFVFKMVLKVQMPHYLVFILAGVFPWNFFAQSVLEGMESIVGNWGLVSKVPIPVQMFPYVGTLTNAVTLALSSPILLGAAWLSHAPIGVSLCILPFYLIALFLMTYGFALILSIGFVYFRDLRHLMGIVIQAWFYATPVIYNDAMIPAKYRWVLYLNPLGGIFTGFHQILVAGEWPSGLQIGITAFWAVLVLAAATLMHRWLSHEIVEKI